MKMINRNDESDQQSIKRGEQGKRSTRPSSERFLDTKNFDLRKEYKAIREYNTLSFDGGGAWLFREYMFKLRKEKIFNVLDVREGIKKQQRIWAEEAIKKSLGPDAKNSDLDPKVLEA